MTREEKIICKEFLDDADKTHSCNEYKLLMALLEQEPTTKNDLGVDCRSLEDIKKLVERKADDLDGVMLDAGGVIIGLYFAIANDLPSVTPQDIDYKAQYERLSQKAEIVISQLRADRDRLMSLSSVTPQEPKTGHWIANAPQYDMLNPQYICSECGNAHTRTTPYCEMCGAKMVEPQESEE